MTDTVIKIENLSKQYRLGLVGTGTLSHDIKRWWTVNVRRQDDPYLKIGEENDRALKGTSDYVWALKDINLEIKQGDVVGIIGKNGAGKSTLLKILSRVTKPTTGTIHYKGRIASLLEVGTGFHAELTGRENIFMNGAIMGMTRDEIIQKLDEIIDFSGVERYIDTPVKRYSSGMTVRLGFSIAAHLEPDILVVDEVLAVGDAEFQKKAIGKMQDVSKGKGRTVLFVSHNLPSIMELCTTGIMLKDGEIFYTGDVHSVIKKYLNLNRNEGHTKDLTTIKEREGSGKVRFIDYKIIDQEGNEIDKILSGQSISIQANFIINSMEVLPPLHFSVKFVNENDIPLFHMSNSISNGEEFKFNSIIKKGMVSCKIPKFPLQPGEYFFHLFCSDLMTVYDNINFAGTVNVDPGNFFSTGKLPIKNLGDFLVSNEWSIEC